MKFKHEDGKYFFPFSHFQVQRMHSLLFSLFVYLFFTLKQSVVMGKVVAITLHYLLFVFAF